MKKLAIVLSLLALTACASPEKPKGVPGDRAEKCQDYEGYLYEECMAGAPISNDQYDIEREALPDDTMIQ